MESSDRITHRTGTNTNSTSGELFICFTSRHSSSMKISSKSSILSPGRARDPPVSLSTSLSRRLRTSGSIKNGQASPMFPTGGRKRGSGFENPEPSSPKVTCIGQVRVKTKKQGKKMRALSRRESGEVSFRKIEHGQRDQIQRQSSVNSQYHQQECSSHRNQRWVHLPLAICETLRGFGSEFSCLFPCKSSCFSTCEGDKEERVGIREGSDGGQSSCGGVFARWLVAVQEGEGGKGREIELVVGDEEGERPIRSSRRHVFNEIEIKDDVFGVKDKSMKEEEGRVSICIPPKNALLLMRCRSDPVKMEALANRFWEPQLPKEEEEEEDGKDKGSYDNNDSRKEELVNVEVEFEVDMMQKEKLEVFEEKRVSVSVDVNEEQENDPEAEKILQMEVQDNKEEKPIEEEVQINEEEKPIEEKVQLNEEEKPIEGEVKLNEEEKPVEDVQINEELQDGGQEKQEETEESRALVEEENELSFVTAFEALVDQESDKVDKMDPVEDEKEEESRVSYSYTSFSPHSDDEEICKPEQQEQEKQEEALAEEAALEIEDSTPEKVIEDDNLETQVAEKVTQENQLEEESRKTQEEETEKNAAVIAEKESSRLPDCLLLMMCEPKLSMEVSKETWVCSTDFIRWQPQKKKKQQQQVQVKQSDGGDDQEPIIKKRVSVDSNAGTADAHPPPQLAANRPLLQPPRSSCSLPATNAAVSMATMIEQKLVNAVAYEPFVLTRCKSEPMRAASKLAPDACFWKNRTLEPHRRATCGVGAAGVGF